tara:strand:+ start:2297 stop:2920 length:624 start_codon:yes stop_codon:yes gene_type:complete
MNINNLYMNKYSFKRFILYRIKFLPHIFFYTLITFFSLYSSSNRSFEKNKTTVILTLIPYIDNKFQYVIPFLEPAGLDHYSYTPKKIDALRSIVKEVYGYDLLDRQIYEQSECNLKFYRSAVISKCQVRPYWTNLSINNWINISNKYNVNNLITTFKIPSLKACKAYYFPSDNNYANKVQYFHYLIPSSSADNLVCPSINLYKHINK